MLRTLHKYITTSFILLALSGCGGGSDNGSVSFSAPEPTAPANYKIDELNFIQSELKATHPDLFFNRSETDFDADIEELRAQADTISDMAFRLESAKLVAKIGDQHTYMIMHEPSMRKFPIEIWWEQDRAIVIKATPEFSPYLGMELIAMDGIAVADMKDTAMQYLAHENEHWKDALSPRFLRYSELLEHEGLISGIDSASFEFQDALGELYQATVESSYETPLLRIEDSFDNPPLYVRSEDNYWMEVRDDLLFVQYNSCFDRPDYPLSIFIQDMMAIVDSGDVNKVVFDIRFNFGGIIDHFLPVVNRLVESDMNQAEKLFVLTGRNTFSSGVGTVYNFVDLTNATFVGMPTGGKPNGFSNVIGYRLPGSFNSLYMSTAYLAVTEDTVDTFTPDFMTPFTQEDFINGLDPALEFISQNW